MVRATLDGGVSVRTPRLVAEPRVDHVRHGGSAGHGVAQQRSLARTAATASPVEAGRALRAMDHANGGNRGATNAQVRAEVTTRVDDRTLFRADTRTVITRSDDGVESTTGTTRSESRVNERSATLSQTETQTRTTREYDATGKTLRADPVTGQPLETVQSRSERSSSVTVDGNGLSTSSSASERRGTAGGKVESRTSISEKGVSSSGSVSGNVGDLTGRAGGGLTFGPDGVGANGSAGLGPVSVEARVDHVQQPDLTRTTATTAIKLQSPDGKPVTASAEYRQTNVDSVQTHADGSTTWKVKGETRLTLAGGVDAKQVKVDTSWLEGQRTEHTITVPKGGDVTRVNPTDPASWPEGTRVMIKSEDYQGSTLGFAYRNFGVQAGTETREGTAIVMTREADATVSVATGPTAGFTTSGKLTVDIGAGFGFELGGQNVTDFTFYRTYRIELAADGGQQTFHDTLTGREAPAANANGVSDLMDVTTGTWNYTGSAQVTTPLGDFGSERKEGSNTVWRTLADGTVEMSRTYDADGDGKPELTTSATTHEGATFRPTYTYHLRVTSEGQLHNFRQFAADPTLAVGDTVHVELTQRELLALRERDWRMAPLEPESTEVQGRQAIAYSEYVARSGGADGMIEKLFTLENSNKAHDYNTPPPQVDLDKPLPGEVRIERG